MNNHNVIDLIYRALRDSNLPEVHDVHTEGTMDQGHETSQLVLTTDDLNGEKQDWVIDAENVNETTMDYDDSCQRCGCELDGGYCTNKTCPFSDHIQACPRGWLGHPEHAIEPSSCICLPDLRKSDTE